MGCTSCGGGGSKQVTQVYNGQVEQTMVEYFENLGWVYIGLCGCKENHKVYTNPNIPKWQVWVHQMGNTVQFRRIWSPADIQRMGQSGTADYKQGYEYWVLNSEMNIT